MTVEGYASAHLYRVVFGMQCVTINGFEPAPLGLNLTHQEVFIFSQISFGKLPYPIFTDI
jgi:hypothetical protein